MTVALKSGYVVRTGKEGKVKKDVETATDSRHIWKKQGWSICTMQLPTDNGASFVNDIANNNGKDKKKWIRDATVVLRAHEEIQHQRQLYSENISEQ